MKLDYYYLLFMFLYPLENDHNMFKRRRLDPKNIFSCNMNSNRTMVVIRFKMWQIPRIQPTLEENAGYSVSTL
jgi:hypothetical protein